MKNRKNRTTLLVAKLEGIGRGIFDKGYKKILKKHIGDQPGVYALYKKEKLYYVGQAQKLASRITLHLSNKHARKWDNFSIYIAKRRRYVPDLEAVVIAIADPKGNTQQPQLAKLKKATKLRRLIEKDMKEQTQKIMGLDRKARSKRSHRKSQRRVTKTTERQSKARNKSFSLVGLFNKNKLLLGERTKLGEQNKTTYQALLLTSGKVLYKGKEYSLSGAGKVATGLETNGWTFWQIQDHKNRWVTLSTLREKSRTFKKVA